MGKKAKSYWFEIIEIRKKGITIIFVLSYILIAIIDLCLLNQYTKAIGNLEAIIVTLNIFITLFASLQALIFIEKYMIISWIAMFICSLLAVVFFILRINIYIFYESSKSYARIKDALLCIGIVYFLVGIGQLCVDFIWSLYRVNKQKQYKFNQKLLKTQISAEIKRSFGSVSSGGLNKTESVFGKDALDKSLIHNTSQNSLVVSMAEANKEELLAVIQAQNIRINELECIHTE